MNTLDFSDPFTERTPRIVQAAKLHRAAARKKADRFLVEGVNSVEAAIATGAATDAFFSESAAAKYPELITLCRNLSVYAHPISEKAARHLTDTVTSTGVFALCKPVLWSTAQALGRSPQLVSIPVATSDPGNAGTLIRIADAVGADAVLFAGETVDPQSPKAVRSSAGSLFHIPVARSTNAADVIGQARSKGLQVLATSAQGEVSLDEAGALLEQPTAWLFGNEAHGLSEEDLARADHRIRIPIRGRAESLNLATAAAICLYESAKAQAAKAD